MCSIHLHIPEARLLTMFLACCHIPIKILKLKGVTNGHRVKWNWWDQLEFHGWTLILNWNLGSELPHGILLHQVLNHRDSLEGVALQACFTHWWRFSCMPMKMELLEELAWCKLSNACHCLGPLQFHMKAIPLISG